jgi:hypothetical protein
MPLDEDVLEDFGFNNVPFGIERNYLLGVYQGLYLSGSVSTEDIHQWRIAGILADKIKEFYFGLPASQRGQYFPWFLRNSHVLDRTMSKKEAVANLIVTFYDQARPYLDEEDRGKIAKDLQPQAKTHSYHLLAGILRRMHPNPMEENWCAFGFVTCRNKSEERILAKLYQLLLTCSNESSLDEVHNSQRGIVLPATFARFWKAHESMTLIPLMDSKGFKNLRSGLPYLEAFLSDPTVTHLSVWDLKQFLQINNPVDHPPEAYVRVDYGFVNCRSAKDTCTLMEIYDRVLKSADPLKLHNACIEGSLFEFAGGYLHMKEQWRSLMRNPYRLKK